MSHASLMWCCCRLFPVIRIAGGTLLRFSSFQKNHFPDGSSTTGITRPCCPILREALRMNPGAWPEHLQKRTFMTTFNELNLHQNILKAISSCGYTNPTPVQAAAIPLALEGKDLIATAQTGTGKTAAFVLPILQRLTIPSQLRGRGPRILILTPTRELANQITDAIKTYGRNMRIRSGAILGGMPYPEQMRLLAAPVDIIIATPGRLIDHLDRGRLDLSRVEALVLDEADRMLDMGFSEAVDRIAGATPASRQTMLYTATMDAPMAKLAGRLLNSPERVEIAPEQITHDAIEQRLHVTDDLSHKNRLLDHLIENGDLTKAIIFSATKRDADQLATDLRGRGLSAAALHGDMSQGARNRTIQNMKNGRIRLLVATDVAARGLDVNGISHVINFDLPKFAEDYVHRIGRTGRAGATGIAISFASRNDLQALLRIEKFIGNLIPEHRIPGLEPTRTMTRQNRRSGTPTGQGPRTPGRDSRKPHTSQAKPFQRKPSPRHEPVIEYRSRKPTAH